MSADEVKSKIAGYIIATVAAIALIALIMIVNNQDALPDVFGLADGGVRVMALDRIGK